MSKRSVVERNKKRKRLEIYYRKSRETLKIKRNNKSISVEERFYLTHKLSNLPRNSCTTRIRNRCELSGRGRGVYSKFKLSRINLRILASYGLIPGVSKSSW
jgi:small subunit ribosomal protein S14